ncbi:ethanolaminephosphotransferase [Pelomyxa schiedti]|nr:ethanolaminephosphotransferase [Pelomyxa schiedti]
MGPLPAFLVHAVACWFLASGLQPPLWLNLCASFAVLWFMLMDNVDGKHARSINCCSPVGDWLDHSLDPLTYFILLSNICIMAHVTTGWMIWFILVSTSLTYELVMWECYFTGKMVLNEFDASTEGIFCLSIAHIVFVLLPNLLDVIVHIPLLDTSLTLRDIMFGVVIVITLTALASLKRSLSDLKKIGHHIAGILHLCVFLFPAFCGMLFRFWLPEVCASHFYITTLHTLLTGIFWIYTTIIHRLVGWPLKDVHSTLIAAIPLFVWSLLPLALSAVLPANQMGKAMNIIGGITISVGICWWITVGKGMCMSLGLPLLTIPKKKQP